MLWIRLFIFTLVVPVVGGIVVPWLFYRGLSLQSGLWEAGWIFLVIGSAIYVWCLLSFFTAGGTPALFFTRHLKFLIGEEPSKLMQSGLYRVSRNPMYIGAVLAVLGQAIIFASLGLFLYTVVMAIGFYLVVVLMEEPHLRKKYGPSYDAYCQRVPRWFSLSR